MSITAAIIDTREPDWVRALTFGGAMTACSQLDAGDLLVTVDDDALLAIERKTPSDLLNSIRDDRIWAQLAGIRSLTPWAYLLITGELQRSQNGKVIVDRGETGWAWAAVQGVLLQAQEMGVFVVQCAGDADYEPAVIRLSARSHRKEMLVPCAREPRILSDTEKVLTALPGVGLERVQALTEYAGSAAWALQYLTDTEFKDHIEGVGNGTKAAVRRALGLRDNQSLAVVITESGQLADKE
jgi:ERCC4-type nuclease